MNFSAVPEKLIYLCPSIIFTFNEKVKKREARFPISPLVTWSKKRINTLKSQKQRENIIVR